jgi:hypothetical protein
MASSFEVLFGLHPHRLQPARDGLVWDGRDYRRITTDGGLTIEVLDQ